MTLQADRPIMLITATPGGGKTALAVEIMAEAVDNGRTLFVMGIPELNLPHVTCPPIAEWTETRTDPDNPELSLPYFTFPPNSLVVLDEAQRVFRLRASASKVPDHVAAFDTVRHTGVTFLLITQHPNFIDSHIRNLVGQHVHLRDVGLLGRWYYEWPETSDPKTYQTAPIKKRWKLPKKSFDLYKSSSLHIKRNYSMPPALLTLIICLLLVAFGCYFVISRVQDKITPQDAKTTNTTGQALAAAGNAAIDAPLSPVDLLQEFVPVVPSRPETAPAYDSIRTVKVMPQTVGCYQSAKRCTCVNQQGLDAGLDALQCRDWLANPPFNPYREESSSNDQVANNGRVRGHGVPPAPALTIPPAPPPNFATLPA
jgi:zona occludens toxin